MKISDFIFQYRPGRAARQEALCRVRLFVLPSSQVFVLLTDLGELGTGMSVTNSVEWIRLALIQHGIVRSDVQVIEHYERETPEVDTFDHVTFRDDGSPIWRSISGEEAANCLGCSPTEFLFRTEEDSRLRRQSEAIKHGIDPFFDSPYPTPPEFLARRLELERRMLPNQAIAELIKAGAGERSLQKVIKQDLSFLAETFAHPREDFICFSEFPLADGVVDFAVFTGVSRMDVILIEVKGADFNLINQGSHGNFSARMNEAAQQIRKRVGDIYRNYSEFCSFAHQTRIQVEGGQRKHNALVGPTRPLQVDSDKDINIRTVVIGGRSHNDLKESRLRHQLEWGSTPSIRVESWDSWLRKLRRA